MLLAWFPLNNTIKNQGESRLEMLPLHSSTTLSGMGCLSEYCYYNSSNTTGGYVSANKLSFNGVKQSMFAWVKFDSLMSGAELGGSILGTHRYKTFSGMGITIKYISSTTGYLSVNTGNGTNRTYNTYIGSTLLRSGLWYHVGFTFDGTTICLYVNGTLDGTYSDSHITNMYVPDDYLMIGTWSLDSDNFASNAVHGNYKLYGSIQDARVYNHVLSTVEIKDLYNGLGVCYNFDNIYKRIHYLESSGTQRIKLDVIPKSSSRIEAEFTLLDKSSTMTIWCARGSSTTDDSTTAFYILNDGIRCDYGTGAENHTQIGNHNTLDYGQMQRLVMDKNKWYLNGELKVTSASSTFTAGNKIQLFCSYFGGLDSNLGNYSRIRLYEFKVYDNNLLICYCIPVLRTTDGKPGLYDTVSGKFYTNSGTGDFSYSFCTGPVYSSNSSFVRNSTNTTATTIKLGYPDAPTLDTTTDLGIAISNGKFYSGYKDLVMNIGVKPSLAYPSSLGGSGNTVWRYFRFCPDWYHGETNYCIAMPISYGSNPITARSLIRTIGNVSKETVAQELMSKAQTYGYWQHWGGGGPEDGPEVDWYTAIGGIAEERSNVSYRIDANSTINNTLYSGKYFYKYNNNIYHVTGISDGSKDQTAAQAYSYTQVLNGSTSYLTKFKNMLSDVGAKSDNLDYMTDTYGTSSSAYQVIFEVLRELKTINKVTVCPLNGWGYRGILSKDKFDKAFIAATVSQTTTYIMIGLSPEYSGCTTSDFWTYTHGYYLYPRSDGTYDIYEMGNYIANYGTYSTGDRFKVTYDGIYVRYFVNDVLIREVAVSISYPVRASVTSYNDGYIKDLAYGELTSNFDISGFDRKASGFNSVSVIHDITKKNTMNSISFNGSSSKIDTHLRLTDSMTFACWVKFNNSGGYHIIDFRNPDGEEGYQPLYGGINYGIQIHSKYGTNNISHIWSSSECGFELNKWYHLAAVISPTYAELYVNGESLGKHTANYGQNIRSTLFRLGSRCSNANWFDGEMSDIRVYYSILSDESIRDLYETRFKIDNKYNFYCNKLLNGSEIKMTEQGTLNSSYISVSTSDASTYKIDNNYTVLEYIESDGNSYIDTGYYHKTSKTKYEAKMCVTTLPNIYNTLFGSRINHDGNEAYYFGISNETTNDPNYFHLYGCIGGKKVDPVIKWYHTNTLTTSSSDAIVGVPFIIVTDPNWGIMLKRNARSNYSYGMPYNAEVTAAFSDYIFGGNFSGTFSEGIAARLYYFKIYEENILVHEFIPVKRKSDNTLGLYDTIFGVFYTKLGSGSFTAGPELEKASFIYCNNIYTGGSSSVIQDKTNNEHHKFEILEYIETTSGMATTIDTGIRGPRSSSYNTRVEVDCQFTDVSTTQQRLFGYGYNDYNANYSYYSSFEIYINGSGNWARATSNGAGNWQSTGVVADTNRHLFCLDNYNMKIYNLNIGTNVEAYNAANSSNISNWGSDNIYLFGRNTAERDDTTSQSSHHANMKLYSCKIWEISNNTEKLSRNFIPVRNTMNGSIGLYDMVGDTFYGKYEDETTIETFIPGPVIGYYDKRMI